MSKRGAATESKSPADGLADSALGYLGHRGRLRSKFRTLGASALADYELVELALTIAIPRRDTKPAAKALLAAFGSTYGIITADHKDLAAVSGVGETGALLFKVAYALGKASLLDKAKGQPVMGNFNSLMEYCRVAYGASPIEVVAAIYLDTAHHIIADEVCQTGTVNRTAVYPRQIAKRALELNASSVVLCHNHPAGKLEPSSADIELTVALAQALLTVEMKLVDHIIVSRTDAISFNNHGFGWCIRAQEIPPAETRPNRKK
ncbi:DNA repair protein RadC [Alphaproteobacteria bacterium]|nr:DNA repair protein RadC [Alphaproteobacteria bacterium]